MVTKVPASVKGGRRRLDVDPLEGSATPLVAQVASLSSSRTSLRTCRQPLAAGQPALNFAFDVTPARLVTAIITEHGIAKPGELAALFPQLA